MKNLLLFTGSLVTALALSFGFGAEKAEAYHGAYGPGNCYYWSYNGYCNNYSTYHRGHHYGYNRYHRVGHRYHAPYYGGHYGSYPYYSGYTNVVHKPVHTVSYQPYYRTVSYRPAYYGYGHNYYSYNNYPYYSYGNYYWN